MICDFCRRDVDYVKASFWHGEAKVCRECFAQWCDLDNVYTGAGDAASIGNYVRLQHGLPMLAAALAILLLTGAPTAHASRHCLDQAEAARTWPTQVLVKDGDGCWTYDHRPRRAELPVAAPKTPAPVQETTMMRETPPADRGGDTDVLALALRLEPKRVSESSSPPGPFASAQQFALFVALVLAITSVIEVATGGRANSKASRPRWPDRQARMASAEAMALNGPFRPGATAEAQPALQ
jgi:hypothetical protein